MKLEANLTGYFYESGHNIPVKEYTVINPGLLSQTKEFKEQISKGDSFADLISIDKKDNVLWFDSGYEEYLYEQKDELEEWLKQYFTTQQATAILGFMRRLSDY